MARVDISNQLTEDEVLVLQAITDGTYFIYSETPLGLQDSSNLTFTLSNIPTPPSSLCLFLNGQLLTETEQYTLAEETITFVVAPDPGDTIRASYTGGFN